MKWPDRLVAFGCFFAFFSGYLFLKGPAVNLAQLAFRVCLLGLGIILATVGLILKLGK